MATVLSTLYPPLIGTFQPAFEYDDGPEITFTISNYNSYVNIKHLHISLVNQKTNQNVFATNSNNAFYVPVGTYLIDGIWIVPFQDSIFTQFDTENNLYKIKIPKTILKNKITEFIIDYYYKVQLRFDCVTDDIINSNSDNSDVIFNSTYLNKYRSFFSEWSSISLLKAVPHTEIQLTNFTITNSNGITNNNLKNKKIPQFTPGVVPIIGKLVFFKDNKIINVTDAGKEWIKDYQIKIYRKEDDESNTLILDSDIIYPDTYKFNENKLNISSKSQSDYWTNNFSYLADLTDQDTNYSYTLNIIVHTKNNFTVEELFDFKLINALFTPIWTWSFDEKELPYYGNTIKEIVTEEDGEISGQVKIEPELDSQSTNYMYQQEPGYMFIRRADSLSNFKNWTIIKCVACSNPLEPVKFTDKTVGSLVRYRYSAQYLCFRGGVQTSVNKSPIIIYPDFHDILISAGDKQLAIRYNGQINSMTSVVNRVKIDTLGGQYPKFAENAKLNYKQFNLSGLLTAESDYNRKFLNDLDYLDDMRIYDDTQKGTYLVRNDTMIETFDSEHAQGTYTNNIMNKISQIDVEKESSQKNTNHDIYPTNNWWWERKFREEAIKWLNNGQPKLYRSMTEGNMIVMIDGISLTPNNQLGRRTWNFSCTVYEIGDGYDLKLLNDLNIFNIQNDYEQKNIDLEKQYEDGNEPDSLVRKTVTTLGQQYEIQAIKDSQNNYIDIVKNIIVNDINSLYQGLGKNYIYKEDSALIHNLKINFTSPPQYYNLNSNIEKIDTNEFFSKRIDIDNFIATAEDEEFFLTNDVGLGYKIVLSYYNTSNGTSTKVPIFVSSTDGRTGYYQIPSNLIISEIILYDDATAILDYYLTYKLDYYNADIPDFYSQEETLVGQVNDYWSFGMNIGNYINGKYKVYNWTEDDSYEYSEGLVYWKGINIESDPYSIYEISYRESVTGVVQAGEKNTYIIPRSGTLNLLKNYEVLSCWAAGRQMFVVDEERKSYLDEWECVLDETVTNPYVPGNTISDGEYWYLVKSSDSIELDKDNNNNYILVKIRVADNNLYIVNNDSEEAQLLSWDDFNDGILDIYEDWFNLDALSNCIINNITNPDYNKVYRIIDNNFVSYYMIYYLNQGWYPIEFIDNSHQDVMRAKVPISGMIEYKADIYKQGWEILNKQKRNTNSINDDSDS